MNRHILRWQPEGITSMPEGMGLVPFMLPGSAELMLGTVKTMRDHRMALWAKHGVIVRSDTSVKQACDLIEYAETGARYECLNLTNHGIAEGLSAHELRMLCDAMQIEQRIF
jgi:rhamnulose-1-phosphate aldolase